MAPPEGIFRPARTVMIGRALGLLGAFAGFIVVASVYGATPETDVFNCAYAVPYAFLVVAGATLSQSFIGAHARIEADEGPDSARRFGSACLTLSGLALAILALAGMALAPWLAAGSGSGLRGPEVERATHQLRWLLPLVVAGGVANLAKGVLNARFVFFTPSLDTFATYAGLVPVVAFGAGRWGIWALVAGTVAGNVLRLVVMLPDLLRIGARPVLWHPRVPQWASTIAPLAFGAAFLGANVVLIRSLASLAPGGDAVSNLVYAERLVMVPSELIAASLGIAMLPAAAAKYATHDRAAFARITATALRTTLLFLIPAAVGIALLAHPLVALVYEHGRFGREDTEGTAGVLKWFALILPGSASLVLGQSFFAIGRIRAVVVMWIGQTAITLAGGLLLVGAMGEAGVALAYSVSALTVTAGALWTLGKAVPEFRPSAVLGSALRMAIASAAMGAAVWAGERQLQSAGRLDLAVKVGLLGLSGAAVYMIAMALLRAPEWTELKRRLSRNLT